MERAAAEAGSVIYSRGSRLSDQSALVPAPQAGAWRLPLGPDRFVGRDRDIDALYALLGGRTTPEAHGALTLVGVGGVGKTRLALEFAHRLAPLFPDGSCLVPVDEVAGGTQLPHLLLDSLGIAPKDDGPLDQAIDHLATRRMLVVLDNCEHLLDDCASLLAAIVHGAPRCLVVATSQEPLRSPDERLYRVLPLSLEASTELFAQRARHRRPGFQLDDTTRDAIGRIHAYVGGTPLGMVLAAAWTDTLSSQAVADHIDELDMRGVPQRQRTLWGSVFWSYGLLSAEHQCALRATSVFVGGFSPAAAEEVCGTLVQASRVSRLLADLSAKSLLQVDTAAQEPRYRHLEHVRHFLSASLAQDPQQQRRVTAAHAASFADLARATEPIVAVRDDPATRPHWRERMTVLARLHLEGGNFRAAVTWAEENDEALFQELCLGLWAYWSIFGYLEEGRAALGMLLAQSALPRPARAAALSAAGELARYQGDLAMAVDLHRECLSLQEALRDDLGIAYACNNLGDALFEQGEVAEAKRCYRRALRLRRKLNARASAGYTLTNLARVAAAEGKLSRSLRLDRLAEEELRAVDHEVGVGTVMLNEARTHMTLNELDAAAQCLRTAFDIKLRHHDFWALTQIVEELAAIAGRRDDASKARQLADLAAQLRGAQAKRRDDLIAEVRALIA